mmetsp:Transcript_46276/g.61263  ORF Transcript_46276/g.61263 Transcript_46276/m.61263 type:complete len:169 (+) Transcript_46276:60-566(+)
MHQKREDLISKARQNLGIKRKHSSSRREIIVPDRELHTPVVISATNPMSKHARMSSGLRQKTTLNSDLPSDLISEFGVKTAATYGSKGGVAAGRAPKPIKRGNSLNPKRTKTSSAADLTNLKSSFINMVGRDTPTGTAADSSAFSKRSSATGLPKVKESGGPEGDARP